MKRFSSYLPDDIYEKLRALAFDRKVKQNDILCEALRIYLEYQPSKTKRDKS